MYNTLIHSFFATHSTMMSWVVSRPSSYSDMTQRYVRLLFISWYVESQTSVTVQPSSVPLNGNDAANISHSVIQRHLVKLMH